MVKHSVEQLTQHGEVSGPSLGTFRSEHINAAAAAVYLGFHALLLRENLVTDIMRGNRYQRRQLWWVLKFLGIRGRTGRL